MTFRAFGCLFFAALMTVVALSTGGLIYLLAAILLASALAWALLSSLVARITLTVGAEVLETAAVHGGIYTIKLWTSGAAILPVAPLLVSVRTPTEDELLRVSVPLIGKTPTLIRVKCPHVGTFQLGILHIIVEDVFGFFRFKTSNPNMLFERQVLPIIDSGSIEDFAFSPGESETEHIARAVSDTSSPSGTRDYIMGDELKKIHWKLSVKRQQLVTRTFDQEQRLNALVLLECTPNNLDIQDKLADLAASVCKKLIQQTAFTLMPLSGAVPEAVRLGKNDSDETAALAIARMNFTGTTEMPRVLAMETINMKKNGCVIIITSILTAAMVDTIILLRRHGPFVRVFLEGGAAQYAEHLRTLADYGVECALDSL
ncbi:MAG: DUF58 domain-containing protein [Oscillospiraceae bacterium]|jgi:uncharacterized protein (DUF58 family)|nr:DUF58 domain-containing protein [Oscillospiraceae bacterium]